MDLNSVNQNGDLFGDDPGSDRFIELLIAYDEYLVAGESHLVDAIPSCELPPDLCECCQQPSRACCYCIVPVKLHGKRHR